MSNIKDKKTSTYETVFICDISSGEAAAKALVEKFTGMIAQAGTIKSVNEWGKRRLAYAINDMTEGYYVLITFEAERDFPNELERVFNITEGIMRSMVVRIDESEAVNSANPDEVSFDEEEATSAPAAAAVEEAPVAVEAEAPAAE